MNFVLELRLVSLTELPYRIGPLAKPPVPITKSGLLFFIIKTDLTKLTKSFIGKIKFFTDNLLLKSRDP